MLKLVLVHGFMGTTFSHFAKVIKKLYGVFPIMGIDLPGHGASSYLGELDNYYKNAIQYVIEKIQTHPKVNLVGMSYLGGSIALQVALHRPDLINKLILTGFTYNVPQTVFCAWANGFKLLVEQQTTLISEYQRLHGENWRITMEAVIEDINTNYIETIKTTHEMLKMLDVPSLLINGDYKNNERNAARNFHKFSTKGAGVIIPGAGHIVTFEQPFVFCRVLSDFFLKQ